MELTDSDIKLLLEEDFMQCLSPEERARLIPLVGVQTLQQGELLLDADTEPVQTYLSRSGKFMLERDGASFSLPGGMMGEELLLGSSHYRTCVRAACDATVFTLPIKRLRHLVDHNKSLKRMLFERYSESLQGFVQSHQEDTLDESETGEVDDASTVQADSTRNGDKRMLHALGWVCALLGPIAVTRFALDHGLSQSAAYFIGIVGCTVTMWIFGLAPAFVPPLFSLLAFVLLDVVQPGIASSGFSSTTFFMLLSVFSIGALMVMSGLTYRLSLLVLKILPGGKTWYGFGLFAYGLLLTPIIPSQLARTVIVTPFLSTLLEQSAQHRHGRAANHLVASALAGIALTCPIFLTGKPINVILYGLFDGQTQFTFEWVSWLKASWLSGVLLILAQFGLGRLVFGQYDGVSIGRSVVQGQLMALGRMGWREYAAMGAIGLILVGELTAPLHKIEMAWMSLAVLVALLLFGILNHEDVSKRVDWSVLIFVGAIGTWAPIAKLTGIDLKIAALLPDITEFMKQHLLLFLAALCMVIVLLRLALPEMVTSIICATVLMPIASTAGVSQWLIGFVILVMVEACIFPYQTPHHVMLDGLLAEAGQSSLYNMRKQIIFNLTMIVARVAAIFASIPYWSKLDIV